MKNKFIFLFLLITNIIFGQSTTPNISKVLSVSSASQITAAQAILGGGTASVTITNDVSSSTKMFPMWVTANTGSIPPYVSSTKNVFIPSTGRYGFGTDSLTYTYCPWPGGAGCTSNRYLQENHYCQRDTGAMVNYQNASTGTHAYNGIMVSQNLRKGEYMEIVSFGSTYADGVVRPSSGLLAFGNGYINGGDICVESTGPLGMGTTRDYVNGMADLTVGSYTATCASCVGVGTRTPGAPLHISKQGTANYPAIRIASNSAYVTSPQGGDIQYGSSGWRLTDNFNVIGATSTGNSSYFQNTSSGTSGNQYMGVKNNSGNELSLGILGSAYTPGGTSPSLANYANLYTNATGLNIIAATASAPINFISGAMSTNNIRWKMDASGHFIAGVDNTYDIGASGATRPRTIYAATSVVVAGDPVATTASSGTFVPTITGSGTAGTCSYTHQYGRYRVINDIVYFTIYLDWTGGTGTGNLRISGLPIASKNETDLWSSISVTWQGGGITTPAFAILSALTSSGGGTNLDIYSSVAGGGASTLLAYDASGSFIVTGFYFK